MDQKVSIITLNILIAICCAQPATVDLNNSILINETARINLLNQIFQTNSSYFNNSNIKQKFVSCGVDKECVPRYLCTAEGAISTDGANGIRVRLDVCKELEVCCNTNKNTPEIQTNSTEYYEGCGYRNAHGVGARISSDVNTDAEFGEFPWMVAIIHEEYHKDEVLSVYAGGGSLIAPNVILTAAHKVFNKTAESVIIRAGEWESMSSNEIIPHQDRAVREIIVHENFCPTHLYNNIALLILDAPLELTENIQPVCLPDSDIDFNYSRCYVTGWGKDKFGRQGVHQKILKKIELPFIPRDQCQTNLRRTRLGYFFELGKSFVCAGGEKDKDACDGDGGSPLVCPIPGVKDRYYQVGIVSWGIECGKENVPGVYASIPYLRQWINEKLSNENIDFKYFTQQNT